MASAPAPTPTPASASTAASSNICSFCFKPGSARCAKCKQRVYCSSRCQRKDWLVGHKAACGREDIASQMAPTPAPVPTRALALVPPDLCASAPPNPLRPTPIGLVNGGFGNICYLNAALQALAAAPPLAAALSAPSTDTPSVSSALASFFCRYAAAKTPFLPAEIAAIIPLLSTELRHGRQEDSMEFVDALIHALQHEAVAAKNAQGWPAADKHTTTVDQLLGGWLCDTLICPKCLHTSSSHQPLHALSLDIDPLTDTLAELLAFSTALTRLDSQNKITCAGCEQRVSALKQLRVSKPPNVLLLHLKRFREGFFGKVNQPIAFDATLSLRPYLTRDACPPDVEPKTFAEYNLVAVVVHLDIYNISQLGHYVAFVRGANNQWFYANDEHVVPVPLEKVLQQNAYMLVYTRSEPRYLRDLPLAPDATPTTTPTTTPSPAGGPADLDAFREQWRKELSLSQSSDAGPESDTAAAAAGESSPAAAAATESSPAADESSPASGDGAAAPDERSLCLNGCSFYGSPEFEGYCSSCFRTKFPERFAARKASRDKELAQEREQVLLERRRAEIKAQVKAARQLQQQQQKAAQAAAAGRSLKGPTAPKVAGAKIGRNDPCPCMSGKKYKACHGK